MSRLQPSYRLPLGASFCVLYLTVSSLALAADCADNDAVFVVQDIPAEIEVSGTATAKVEMRNTGSSTWTRADKHSLKWLPGTGDPTWGVYRVKIEAEDENGNEVQVAPQESYEFEFEMTAPAESGTYDSEWRMVHTGCLEFGQPTPVEQVTVYECAENDAEFVHQRMPDLFTSSESKTASVVVKNQGSSTWTRDSGFRLVPAQGASAIWGAQEVELPDGVQIPNGAEHTFVINMTAPQATGTYPSEWRMERRGCGEFGESSPLVDVTVCQTGSCPRPIATRVTSDGNGEFYDRRKGKHIWMRGYNWIRRNCQASCEVCENSENPPFFHAQFDITPCGVDRWDTEYRADAETALQDMADYGYNVVRIFLNKNQVDATYRWPLPYIENFAEFLEIAELNGIHVLTALPPAIFMDTSSCTAAGYGFTNCYYLTQEAVDARLTLMTHMIQELENMGAPMNTIFAYGTNHYYFRSTEPPFSWTSGLVSPYWLAATGGQPYDMSLASDKARLVEDAFVHFSNQWDAAIKAIDPDALTTVSFKNPLSGTPSPVGGRVTLQSGLDFASIHTYPHPCDIDPNDPSLGRWDQFSAWQNLYEVTPPYPKPVFMAEFGAYIDGPVCPQPNYPTIEVAAQAIIDFQVESCIQRVNGWTYWGWDEPEHVFDEIWVGLHPDETTSEELTDIAEALSPDTCYRPIPCRQFVPSTDPACPYNQ